MAFPVLAMAIGAGIGGLYTKASGGSNRDMIKNMFLGAALGAGAGTAIGGLGATTGGLTAAQTTAQAGTLASYNAAAAAQAGQAGLASKLGLSAGQAKLAGTAAVAAPLMMGGGQQGGEFKPPFTDQQYADARMRADEQVAGLGQRFNYDAAPQGMVDNPAMYALSEGGIVNALPRFNKGGNVQYLPSKLDHDEKDVSNYVRAQGYIEDATDIANKDEDTMLAQLADGEFVSRADAVLGAGIMSGANPKDFKEMREKGAKFFYNQQDQLKRIYDITS
tara:strand:- start:217 stop:1047 length:831 start_codon:yes stop_codon:yes gene_type:complete